MTLWLLLGGLALVVIGFGTKNQAQDTEERAARVSSGTIADADGYAEISGDARSIPGYEVKHPRTGEPVVWYRVETRRPNGYTEDANGHRKARYETHNATYEYPFLLDDGTGACLILPRDRSTLGDCDVTEFDSGSIQTIYSIAVGQRLYATGSIVPAGAEYDGATHKLEDSFDEPARLSNRALAELAEAAPETYNLGLMMIFGGGLLVVIGLLLLLR